MGSHKGPHLNPDRLSPMGSLKPLRTSFVCNVGQHKPLDNKLSCYDDDSTALKATTAVTCHFSVTDSFSQRANDAEKCTLAG